MILSGILAVISLACGGYFAEKYIKDSNCCDTTTSYFDEEVVELGIQRKNVLVILRMAFNKQVFRFSPGKCKSKSTTKRYVLTRGILFGRNCTQLGKT